LNLPIHAREAESFFLRNILVGVPYMNINVDGNTTCL
jgi:hypothetical protein